MSLAKGDRLDLMDAYQVWYHGTVLEKREEKNDRGDEFIIVKVGYRVYVDELDEGDQDYLNCPF
jgi:hypothetical protein